MNEKELFEKVYDVLFEHDPEFIKATKKTDAMVAELMESIYEITEDDILSSCWKAASSACASYSLSIYCPIVILLSKSKGAPPMNERLRMNPV